MKRWLTRGSATSAYGIRAPQAHTTRARARRAPEGHRPERSTAPHGWLWAGALLGGTISLVLCAPATWLASVVRNASDGRVLLADAQGTVWNGDAVTVFTGGEGSRDARALPGRLAWTFRPTFTGGPGAHVALAQACCLQGTVALQIHVGWHRLRVDLQPTPTAGGTLGQWPAALLTGLGTPWNTLQPGGALRLSSQALALQWNEGRFAMEGSATLELLDINSRLSTLPRLGSYRTAVVADPAQAGTARVSLSTLDGALQLNGAGSWSAGGLRFRGEASAAAQDEAALNNLLNIIGRRQGARSLISIG